MSTFSKIKAVKDSLSSSELKLANFALESANAIRLALVRYITDNMEWDELVIGASEESTFTPFKLLKLEQQVHWVSQSYQIDLKDKNYSAYHDMAKLTNSEYVFKCVLEDSHRHSAIDDLLELLNGYH